MSADRIATIRYANFRNALLGAVTEGKIPPRTCDLTVRTRSIIHAIAERHPEANPDLIADAYDAYDEAARRWRTGDTRQ